MTLEDGKWLALALSHHRVSSQLHLYLGHPSLECTSHHPQETARHSNYLNVTISAESRTIPGRRAAAGLLSHRTWQPLVNSHRTWQLARAHVQSND